MKRKLLDCPSGLMILFLPKGKGRPREREYYHGATCLRGHDYRHENTTTAAEALRWLTEAVAEQRGAG